MNDNFAARNKNAKFAYNLQSRDCMMHKNSKISHQGIVESVEKDHVRVRIVQASACSSCQAKAMCTSAEAKEKIVDVWGATGQHRIGDEVTVCGSLSMGKRAVLLAFALPLLLMVVWLVVALKVMALNELWAVVGVLAVLCVYYVLLSLFRQRLSRTFSFWIES